MYLRAVSKYFYSLDNCRFRGAEGRNVYLGRQLHRYPAVRSIKTTGMPEMLGGGYLAHADVKKMKGSGNLRWGVPLGITVAAVALKKIGYDASNVSVGWCWVNLDAEDRVLWMLLTGKVWEILAYVTLPVLYILIKKHINRAHAALSEYRPILSRAPAFQPRTSIADKKLILIPVIFIILRIWSTVRFILTLCNSPAVQNSVLVVLHGIGNTFQGGANCIMFVLCTRVVRTRLFSSICCCRYDELDWPLQRSNSYWDHPEPHNSKDVPGPERTKPLLSST
ncbi:G-protein coupled receptor 157 isoform X4 [Ciconia boyciana]|uniref:G-protein coupled receptor 157 isoform X4 n=1 Tax=Ciconia boyciana TaxID=52775 RepID=UPI003BA09E1E